MTQEQLSEANDLNDRIEKIKKNIEKARWMLAEGVSNRKSTLSAIGVQDLPIQAKFFQQIAKMVVEEYSQELFYLEQQLEIL
jgi:DNA-directed RNA polymerase specialized sigma54-like protein